MKIKLMFLLIAMLLRIELTAQVPLSTTTNTLRHGDILCKMEVPYVEAGEQGEEVVWQLGEITDDSREYLQTINSNGDTIAIYEEGRILHYLMRNDTLYNKGMQSRRTYRIFSEERPVLHYPFQYGDSIAGTYAGNGREENYTYQVQGFGYTVADGAGMLTDGVDTLRHIVRLHQVDDYYLDDRKTEPIHITEEHYQWYCAGYRYAIMESVRTIYCESTKRIPLDSITYLYLPVMQCELAEDEANEALLENLALLDATGSAPSLMLDNALSAINATLSSDGTMLNIDYELDRDTPISFYACDIMGVLLASAQYLTREAGVCHDQLILARRPIGNTLMLRVQCGTQTLLLKVAVE